VPIKLCCCVMCTVFSLSHYFSRVLIAQKFSSLSGYVFTNKLNTCFSLNIVGTFLQDYYVRIGYVLAFMLKKIKSSSDLTFNSLHFSLCTLPIQERTIEFLLVWMFAVKKGNWGASTMCALFKTPVMCVEFWDFKILHILCVL